MTDFDFCYWLMGYFELREREPFVPEPAQVQLIRMHAMLVDDDSTFAREACAVLDRLGGGDDESVIRELVARLRDRFRDVIDPSYGPGLDRRLAIHGRAGRSAPSDPPGAPRVGGDDGRAPRPMI